MKHTSGIAKGETAIVSLTGMRGSGMSGSAISYIARNHRVAVLRKARKMYWCRKCDLPITPGEYYYCIIWAGAGLGSIKFPDRVHVECLDKFLEG